MKKVSTEHIAIGLSVLAIFLFFPVNTMLLTFVVAGIAYAVTQDCTPALAVLLGAIALHTFNVLMKPSPVPLYTANGDPVVENFQPRDPISIHQRISNNKGNGPLKPKVRSITGVLESPNILSSFEVRSLADEEVGAAARTMPAGVRENFRIQTVEEASMPPSDSEKPVLAPYLQNGPDKEGEELALLRKGTDGKVMPAGDLKGLPGV